MISPGRRTSIRVKRKGSDLMPLMRTGQKAGSHCSWIRSRPNRLGLIFRDDRPLKGALCIGAVPSLFPIADFAGWIAKALTGRQHQSSSPKRGQTVLSIRVGLRAYRPEGSDQMRYVLAAIFVCAVGMPAASALPTVSPNSVSVSKADPRVQVVRRDRLHPRVQVVRRNRPHSHRHSRSGDGIHPLVGSGDY
jgi:hypothetical protein